MPLELKIETESQVNKCPLFPQKTVLIPKIIVYTYILASNNMSLIGSLSIVKVHRI